MVVHNLSALVVHFSNALDTNMILALRCAKYNGTFERVFELYKQRSMRGQSIPPSLESRNAPIIDSFWHL